MIQRGRRLLQTARGRKNCEGVVKEGAILCQSAEEDAGSMRGILL